MDLQILPGEKFSALALVRALREDFASPIDLGGDLWALVSPPVDVDALWRTWLGSITAESIGQANFWLVAKRPGRAPEVLDEENEDLKNDVWHSFLGLLVLGTPRYDDGYLLTGAHVQGSLKIRQYSKTRDYEVSWDAPPLHLGDHVLRSALPIRTGIRTVFEDEAYMRVRRGISVFLSGLEEGAAISRLHQFVRAVEAVIKPSPPGIKKKFMDRCRTFVGANPLAETIVGECYELRSKGEHLLDWEDALMGYPSTQREEIARRRMRQAETLARHVYRRILTSAAHAADFADKAIDGYWIRPEQDRMTRWGMPLDITSVS